MADDHKDEDWADKVLCPNLENTDLKVCIDYRDFPVGKPAIINMQEAAKTSKQVANEEPERMLEKLRENL